MGRPGRANDAFTIDDLEAQDWVHEVQPQNHPVKIRVTRDTIFNLETGEVICQINPNYRFYWAHSHPHICPASWKDEERALLESSMGKPRNQVAKPL